MSILTSYSVYLLSYCITSAAFWCKIELCWRRGGVEVFPVPLWFTSDAYLLFSSSLVALSSSHLLCVLDMVTLRFWFYRRQSLISKSRKRLSSSSSIFLSLSSLITFSCLSHSPRIFIHPTRISRICCSNAFSFASYRLFNSSSFAFCFSATSSFYTLSMWKR